MTDLALDPFEHIRGELLRGMQRDVRRSRYRGRVLRVGLIGVAVVAALGSIAIAANEGAPVAPRPNTGSVLSVFHSMGQEAAPALTERHDSSLGDGALDGGLGKVLLKQKVDGVNVQINAVARFGNDGNVKRTKPRACYTVSTDLTGGMRSEGTTCTDAFNPGLPINFQQSMQLGGGSDIASTISGITDNAVMKVEFLTLSGTYVAAMGDHAFWWRGKDREHVPLKIRVTLDDGTVKERPTYAPYTMCDTPEIRAIKAWGVKNTALEKCQAKLLAQLPPVESSPN